MRTRTGRTDRAGDRRGIEGRLAAAAIAAGSLLAVASPAAGQPAATQPAEAAGEAADAGAEAGAFEETALGEMVIEAVPQLDRYGRDGEYYTRESSFALGGTLASLRNTPFSISTVDEDFLKDVNPTQLDAIAQHVPGVQMGNQNSNFSQVFQSRGFQIGRDSLLINGTQQSDAFAITPDELVSSVEFLRGPSSVLNGQSPPGGSVNIVTKKPMGETFVRVTGEYNQHDKRKAAVDINLADLELAGIPASFRLNVMGEDSDSFRDAVEREVGMVAPVLTLRPTDRTTLTFEANIIEWQTTDDRGLPFPPGADADEATERFDESEFLLGTTAEQNDRDQQRFMLDASHDLNEHITTNFQLSYGETDRSFHSVIPMRFVPAPSDPNRRFRPAPALNVATGQLTRSHFGTKDTFESLDTKLDTEFQFKTGFLSHRGVAGVQFRDFENRESARVFTPNADQVNVNNPNPSRPFSDFGPGDGDQSDTSAIEGFIQDEVRVVSGPLAGVRAVLGGRFISFEDDLDSRRDEDKFVPRLGVSYTPPALDWMTLYGSYSESFNPQPGTTTAGRTLPPREGEQWEIGAKAELFKKRLLLTGAFFDLESSNVGVDDRSTPMNQSDRVAIGLQESKGLEFEAVGKLLPGVQARAQYSYNDAEVVRDPDRVGNELQLAPDHSGSLWLRYNFPKFSGPFPWGNNEDQLSLAAGVVYVGDRFATIDNQVKLTSYARFDLSGRYRIGGRTEFTINLKNVTDERYFTGGESFQGGTNASVLPGQPFTVALGLTHEF